MTTIFACICTSSRLASADLVAIMGAAEAQLTEDYAPAWERKAGLVVEWPAGKPIPPANEDTRVVPCYFRESTADDDQNALAYHWVNPDTKLVEIVVLLDRIANEGGSFVDAVSCGFTHEVIETEGDEFADDWTDCGDGTEQPKELCDRVQGYSYTKTVKDSVGNSRSIAVSDFLLPNGFNQTPPAGAKFDFLGKLPTPFALGDGGYTGSRQAGGGETTVFGDKKAALAYSHKAMARRGVDIEKLR